MRVRLFDYLLLSCADVASCKPPCETCDGTIMAGLMPAVLGIGSLALCTRNPQIDSRIVIRLLKEVALVIIFKPFVFWVLYPIP